MEINEMIRIGLRLGVGLVALAGLALAAGALVRPEAAAARLGLAADGGLGLSTLRGDLTALFGVIGAFCAWAAAKGRGGVLAAPALALATALAGRLVSAVVDGSGAVALPMMAVEVGLLTLVTAGWLGLGGRRGG